MTTETARIDDELHRAYGGACWHGPPLREVLTGVTAEVAARKHPALTHSIGALVNHIAAWTEVVRLRIEQRRALAEPAAGDFPPVADTSPAAWEVTLAELDRQQRLLLEVVASLDAAQLDEIVPG